MAAGLCTQLRRRELVGPVASCAAPALYSSKRWVRELDINMGALVYADCAGYIDVSVCADDLLLELFGHLGCVNALTWSEDGSLLASGSDDQRVIIWDFKDGFSTKKVIETGHTANIFSTQFLPNSSNRIIISCAGDRQIRLSDIEYSSSVRTNEATNRVYHCHRDRVKRIVLDENPNCFLTCSEDGDVRFFDLRHSHQCSRHSATNGSGAYGCPPPLLSYRPQQIDLNTITLSRAMPQYFVVGGAHVHAFLHDRRMIGRSMEREWGVIDTVPGRATQCVRKFAPDGRYASATSVHITACKLGDANPRELLGSWSADHVYLFDIHDTPVEPLKPPATTTSSAKRRLLQSRIKRKRRGSRVVDVTASGSSLGSGSGEEHVTQQEQLQVQPHLQQGRQRSVGQHTEEIALHPDPHTDDVSELSTPPELRSVPTFGARLVQLRRELNTDENTRQMFLMASETACELANDMVASLHIGSSDYLGVREHALRFVRACGAVAESLAFHVCEADAFFDLDEERWSADVGGRLWIEPAWSWRYDFVRCLIIWLRAGEYTSSLSVLDSLVSEGPEEDVICDPLDPRGVHVLFQYERDAAVAFRNIVRRQEITPSVRQFWGLKVMRALLWKEGQGIDYGFVDAAWPEDEDETNAPVTVFGMDGAHLGRGLEYEDDEVDSDDHDSHSDQEDDNDDLVLPAPYRRLQPCEPHIPIVSHRQRYTGHCNTQTVKDVNFYGLGDEYVVSGSDDGSLFIWDKLSTRCEQLLRGDQHVVNVIQGNPVVPMLAVSGIDSTIKIFSPIARPSHLPSRRALRSHFQITTANEMHRRQGQRDTHITRSMLNSLASQIRSRQLQGGEGDAEGNILETCRVS